MIKPSSPSGPSPARNSDIPNYAAHSVRTFSKRRTRHATRHSSPAAQLLALFSSSPRLKGLARTTRGNSIYELLDRYTDAGALGLIQTGFEAHLGKWACAPQSAMLRYFLRVAPVYGASQVRASLSARKDTHCYSYACVAESMASRLEKPTIRRSDDSVIAGRNDLGCTRSSRFLGVLPDHGQTGDYPLIRRISTGKRPVTSNLPDCLRFESNHALPAAAFAG
jgi:hypothetical protein